MQLTEANYNEHGLASAESTLTEFEHHLGLTPTTLPGDPPPELDRWPAPMREEAFHGLAGDFVRLVSPETEADPQALLLTLLAGVGCMMGRDSYYPVGSTRHHPNLFVAVVGDSAKARKGTATDCVMAFLKAADEHFLSTRRVSGLSSGEGLIHAVRDASGEGEDGDPGVTDKRLLVVETELAQPLQTGKREGSTLSPTIRTAWDGAPLRTLAKTNKDACQEPHIGIIGNITVGELQQRLTASDKGNGFANRFLWCCAKRSKHLPFGGEEPDAMFYGRLVSRLQQALQAARTLGRVTWSVEARPLWARLYPELGKVAAGESGLQAGLTARAEPQCIRLAMIYALLDSSAVILPVHLEAAVAVWGYCAESVEVIFASSDGGGAEGTILDALAERGGEMSRTDISNRLGRHVKASELGALLDALVRAGRIVSRTERTGGASRTLYRLRVAV